MRAEREAVRHSAPTARDEPMTKSMRAGAVGTIFTTLAMLLWHQIERWINWGSGYTDLPGQDTSQLLLDLQPYVAMLLALIAGRVSGLLCASHRWLAGLLSVTPLLGLFAVSPAGFNASHWYLYLAVPVIAMIGACAPTWMKLWRAQREGGRAA